ncbi:MAG: glycosyltransferase family 2 protein, partial [Actinobacteria bacterium]|nr:glycosyltransferase family 2 protein [Actinomycetota bacterium]
MKTLVAVVAFNEHVKAERTVSRHPADRAYDLLVLNDGSTDDTLERLLKFPGVTVLSHPVNRGAGASIKTINRYALENGYEVLVYMAGNDKDDPLLIPRLLEPIERDGCDFVQGSRYLPGGGWGRMPFYRVLATRWVHPLLFSAVSGMRITDSTNGFRAFRTALLKDPRIDLEQPWLDQYELEPYLFCKAVRLGYKVREVPV